MKLKELPVSLYHTLKLKMIAVDKVIYSINNEAPVVVSLTTIPSRLSKVNITIRSILTQSPKPKKVVLWINQDHKTLIPKSLKKLESDAFEIRFTHLHCSHKKLIHSLKDFPEYPIVTSDDDCIYRQGWLKSLYETHLKFPEEIIAHRIRCIKKDANDAYLPYKQWICDPADNPKSMMAIGAEGVLYPPGIFPEIIHDEKCFLELAPKADDLWFKAVALSVNVMYRQAENSPKETIPIIGTQGISLKKENIDQDKNRTQWIALANYFNLEID
jgi:hypothetical protein